MANRIMAGSSTRRLRIPSALAVVVIGAATVAGCPSSKPVPVDAHRADARADASHAADASIDAGSADARPIDASPDARPADAPPDTPVV
jgi:hypothetical protein